MDRRAHHPNEADHGSKRQRFASHTDSHGNPRWATGQFQKNPADKSMAYQFGIMNFVSGSVHERYLYSGYKVPGGHLNIPDFFQRID